MSTLENQTLFVTPAPEEAEPRRGCGAVRSAIPTNEQERRSQRIKRETNVDNEAEILVIDVSSDDDNNDDDNDNGDDEPVIIQASRLLPASGIRVEVGKEVQVIRATSMEIFKRARRHASCNKKMREELADAEASIGKSSKNRLSDRGKQKWLIDLGAVEKMVQKEYDHLEEACKKCREEDKKLIKQHVLPSLKKRWDDAKANHELFQNLIHDLDNI